MRKGFTTAELLVAIAMIGVLAALTMPTLLHTYQQKMLEQSKVVHQQRLAQGITMLSVRNPRLAYASSHAFVEALGQYMKIAKICTSDKISECWPYEKVILPDDSEYEISGATSPSVFLRSYTMEASKPEYTNDNAALVTAAGVPVILNFNRACNPNKSDENKTCYSALMDVNGEKGPNKVGVDVFVLNAAGFAGVVVPDSPETAGGAGSRMR